MVHGREARQKSHGRERGPILRAAAMPVCLVAAAASAPADPVARIALFLACILIAAKLGGELAVRAGQPAVLGELLAGIALGNIAFLGVDFLEVMKRDPVLDVIGGIGALVLLFEVGVHSTIGQMLKVGASAFLVATVGVIAPFALGFAVSRWLIPAASVYADAFIGATLCATSVGITARVFKDADLLHTIEARIVLGAAVIDDVLGLLVLALVTATASAADAGKELSPAEVAFGAMTATGFLIGAIVIGVVFSLRVFRLAARLRARGVLIAAGLSFCFVLAWLSGVVGLSPIVGAFAAGLVLEDAHSLDFKARGEAGLTELLDPVSQFLVPVFFVLMGARTDLRALAHPEILGLTFALTAAAIVGKQVCGLAVLEKRVDRVFVGLAMIPRGEVGLVVAGIGESIHVRGEPMIDSATFSAVIIMVVVTTVVTPPLLKWRSS
jgi:Kef-type K+ transport system membrane component KefB